MRRARLCSGVLRTAPVRPRALGVICSVYMADPSPPAVPSPRAAPLPREREFDLLEEMTHVILDAAEALVGTLESRTSADQAWQVIRDLEHKGDAIARDLFESLSAPGIPFGDRDTLQSLTGLLDDVLRDVGRRPGRADRPG